MAWYDLEAHRPQDYAVLANGQDEGEALRELHQATEVAKIEIRADLAKLKVLYPERSESIDRVLACRRYFFLISLVQLPAPQLA